MRNVSINTVHEAEAAMSLLASELEKATEAIRRRAYEYFLERGYVHGKDLDDWLRAEHELIGTPAAEMIKDNNTIILCIQAPGLEPADIHITAAPGSILVQGEASHRDEPAVDEVCFCEFSEKLFRRFDLPEEIDVDDVSAKLDKGILQIVAAKAHAARVRQRQAAGNGRAH